jgi:acetyl esterase/lipase
MIGRICIALAALALLPVASAPAAPAAATTALEPAVAFGARPGVEQISMSPSGNKIAFIGPGPGQSTILYTVDVAAGSTPAMTLSADGNPERLRSCSWVSESRLTCYVYMIAESAGEIYPFERIVAVDTDRSNLRLISRSQRADDAYVSLSGGAIIDALPGEDGAVMMGQEFVPEQRQGSHLGDNRQGYGVVRIDTRTGAARTIEQPKKEASEFITDGHGSVRIYGSRGIAGSTGYDTGVTRYFYRTKDSRDWQQLGVYDATTRTGFNPYAVDPDLDVAYGFKRVDGRRALYSVALDGSRRETLVFAHPEVDLGGLVRIGRRERVVGVTYSTEKTHAVYFDPELQALGRSLSKALPGNPGIQFIDSNLDETKLLIQAGSDVDPGRYYVYDKAAKNLNEIMLVRPDLEGMTLAAVKPVTYRAADGTQVPAYLTLPPGSTGKNIPAIVMPHGGPSARDEWGFDWLPQYFAARGYAVIQPNYRGSSGYGDSWYQRNGFQSWRTAIGDVNDAGRWLVSQGIADPSKLAIVGWSYGGYAALQSNVLDPGLFKAVIAVAPVTDLSLLKEDSAGWSDYRINRDFIGSGPHIGEGSPAQNAGKFQAPVLIFHGDRDFNVRIRQSRVMADRLRGAGKRVELIVYEKLDHDLEDSKARADLLRRSDAFLRASLGIQ